MSTPTKRRPKRRGRPRLPKDERNTARGAFTCLPEQLAAMERAAAAAGKKLPIWLRDVAVDASAGY